MVENPFEYEKTRLSNTLKLIIYEKHSTEKDIERLMAQYKIGIKEASQEEKQDEAILAINRINRMMIDNDYLFKIHFQKRLEYMVNTPYFARIDFKPNEFVDAYIVYIGKHSFLPKDEKFIITDWRSPIASLYYNYNVPTTDAFYEFHIVNKNRPWEKELRRIQGNLSLRRNLDIAEGELISIYDNSLKIDLLTRELKQKTGGKLDDIVKTIQVEQDKIIRSDPFRVCIVQGAAGSGKTTVAIHRISYLLYAYHDAIKEKDILLLSSSKLLVNYVANTLPELEIYSLAKDTLAGYLSSILLSAGYKFNEKLIKIPTDSKKSKMMNKIGFVKALETYCENKKIDGLKYLQSLDNQYLEIERLTTRRTNIPLYEIVANLIENYEEDLVELKLEVKKGNIPLEVKVDAIKVVLKKLMEFQKKFDPLKEYIEFFNSTFIPSNFMGIRPDIKSLDLDDLCSIYYLFYRLYGTSEINKFKQIVIDEAQDLGILQYFVISTLAEKVSGLTLLGDLNQSISDTGHITSWSNLEQVYDKSNIDLYDIKISYRTTRQIITLATKVLSQYKEFIHLPEAFERDGDNPAAQTYDSNLDMIKETHSEISKIRKSRNHRAIGIVAHGESLRSDIKGFLDMKKVEFSEIKENFEAFTSSGLYLVDEKLVKGLEFDTVFVLGFNKKDFKEDALTAKGIFVCITRAINKIYVYSVKSHCGIIEKALKEFGLPSES